MYVHEEWPEAPNKLGRFNASDAVPKTTDTLNKASMIEKAVVNG